MNLLFTSRLGVALLLFSSLALAQSPHPAGCDTNPSALCMNSSSQSVPLIPESTGPEHLQVTFRNGLLRIDADNSMFSDTLRAVLAKIGAVLEFPAGELDERIFAHIGPAPVREVIVQLLNGSRFNYVILSSPSDPTTVARLILTGTAQTHESASPVPVPTQTDGAATAQLYGAGFSTDPDALSVVEPVLREESIGIAASSNGQSPNWAHHDGVKLSGEDLDKMQKLQLKQEQEQQQLQEQNVIRR
jgi:hypothetical protein